MAAALSEAQLKERGRAFDVVSIFSLDLSDMGACGAQTQCAAAAAAPSFAPAWHAGLASVELLSACASLEVLDLSGNQLATLEGVHLPRLRALHLRRCGLDAAFFASPSFPALPALERLHLQGNRVESLAVLNALAAKCPALQYLFLQDPAGSEANPLCALPDYAASVRRFLPNVSPAAAARAADRRVLSDLLPPCPMLLFSHPNAQLKILDGVPHSALPRLEALQGAQPPALPAEPALVLDDGQPELVLHKFAADADA